jgi:hypothetical protein
MARRSDAYAALQALWRGAKDDRRPPCPNDADVADFLADRGAVCYATWAWGFADGSVLRARCIALAGGETSHRWRVFTCSTI